MTRVICPHTDLLQPATVAALTTWAPHTEYVRLESGEMTAYWRLIDRLWIEREAFVLVEHDIEIHSAVMPRFDLCGEPWCLNPYLGPCDVWLEQSLGCTRFSAELLAAEPRLFRATGEVSDGLPPKDWRRVDTVLQDALRRAGYTPHLHHPPVTHHHPY